jgi:hypothetical protein
MLLSGAAAAAAAATAGTPTRVADPVTWEIFLGVNLAKTMIRGFSAQAPYKPPLRGTL